MRVTDKALVVHDLPMMPFVRLSLITDKSRTCSSDVILPVEYTATLKSIGQCTVHTVSDD